MDLIGLKIFHLWDPFIDKTAGENLFAGW